MKKNYMRPESMVVKIQTSTSTLLTGSPNAGLSNDRASINDAESRRYDDWDDWEDE